MLEQRDHQRPAAWQSTNRSFIIWRYHGTADHQTDWPVRRIDGPSRGNAASGVSWVDCFARSLHKDLCNPIAMLSLASCRSGAFRHASTWGVSATPNLPWRRSLCVQAESIRSVQQLTTTRGGTTGAKQLPSADHLPEFSRSHRRGGD